MPTAAAIDTTGWTTYVSERYGFGIGHPPDWTVKPSDHDWAVGVDQFGSTGEERFTSPAGDIQVSAWAAARRGTPESVEGVQAWAEQYCHESGETSCGEIRDRAVPLCNERWDCHPGLLVPFEKGIEAFFTGGFYPQMIVVAVRGPDQGGLRELLEAFLSTMDVCLASPGQTPSGCAEGVPRTGAATGDPLVTSYELWVQQRFD